MKRLSLIAVLASLLACATAPPNLSPAGTAAFKKTQLVHALDAIRDVAIAGNETVPLPLIPENITREVVLWHQTALKVIRESAAGWQATLAVAIEELKGKIPREQKDLLEPYIDLAATLLRGLS